MLTYFNGNPLAVIELEEKEPRIVYLDPEFEELNYIEDYVYEYDLKHSKSKSKSKVKLKGADAILYYRVIKEKIEQPKNKKEVEYIKKKIEKELKCQIGKFMHLNDGIFHPLVDPVERMNIYVAGPEGSGKSYFTAKSAEYWLRLNPEGVIYYFSQKKKDVQTPNPIDRLDKYMKRVDMTCENLHNMVIDQFKNCLCVFDDFDALPKGKGKNLNLLDYILQIIEYIVKVGRADNVSIITTSHIMFDNKTTRNQIIGARQVVFFPNHSQKPHIVRYLREYMDVKRDKVLTDIIFNTKRWVLHNVRSPQYFMTEKELIML